MKALTYDRYTAPDGLALSEIAAPVPKSDEILVRVEASSLNAYDWHMYRGSPKIMRLATGLRVKQPRIVAADFAGTVVAVGADVTAFEKSDRIMASAGHGGFAEFATATASCAVTIATGVSFERAAATPMAGLTSLQALRDTGGLRSGERVLIWGASGGVGHLAVQIAGLLSASAVHAVCSSKNKAMVTEQGATRVFDYARDDITASGETYDLILDTVSTQPMNIYRDLLVDGGQLVTVGAVGGDDGPGPIGGMITRAVSSRLKGVDARGMLARTKADDLAILAGWLADGSLTPVIDKSYPLADGAKACIKLEGSHVAGKLVVLPN